MAMTNSTKKTTTRKPRATKPKAKAPAKRAPAKPVELPVNPFLFEILEAVSSQRSAAKKVEVLKKYEHDSLKSIFIWNFDDTVISVVPEGDVPYKENEVPVGTDHTSLRREYKHLYNFVRGGNDGISSLRRETMFIQMLEGLHPEEAKILCLVKDKLLQTKYKISYDIVKDAYPDIQWGGRS